MNIFDEIIERHNTESYKWDFFNDPADTIPMPVADMDFRAPEPVLQTLREVTEHGVMGYSIVPEELVEVLQKRLENLYGWKTEKDWFVWIPGLVPALTATCKAIGEATDAIITPIPVYHPFHLAPKWVGKTLQTFPMKLENNRWTFDFEALEANITENTKLFMLCNPHNPAGTVFTKAELERLADICAKHNIVICSDEIHCDLILDETKPHVPIAGLSQTAADLTITLMAPSKTFNIAGLGFSVAIISNPELRSQFEAAKMGFFPPLSRYSIKAALAAYRDSKEWHDALLKYLKINHDLLIERINALPGLTMYPHEATYLAWIQSDYPDILEKLLAHGVRVIDGSTFMGKGFFRLNFACPKSVLEEAISRIEKAIIG